MGLKSDGRHHLYNPVDKTNNTLDHYGHMYLMSGPWNETSCEYYEEIQQLALLTASREIARGIATLSPKPLSQPPYMPATTRKRWDALAHWPQPGEGSTRWTSLPTRERKQAPPSKPRRLRTLSLRTTPGALRNLT